RWFFPVQKWQPLGLVSVIFCRVEYRTGRILEACSAYRQHAENKRFLRAIGKPNDEQLVSNVCRYGCQNIGWRLDANWGQTYCSVGAEYLGQSRSYRGKDKNHKFWA